MTRAVVAGTIVAATMASTALPALADSILIGEGNSPGDAANNGTIACYILTPYKAVEVRSILRYVDTNGATRFKAMVRCYNN